MSKSSDKHNDSDSLLGLVTDIVAGYVSSNPISANALPGLIQSVHNTLSTLADKETQGTIGLKPAIQAAKSVTEDYIICLEDGKKLKMLKRHLRSKYGLTPEEYRSKWNLPANYPMVAPGYAARRSHLAKKIGLGRKAMP